MKVYISVDLVIALREPPEVLKLLKLWYEQG